MLIHHKGQVSCLIAPSRERNSLSGEHSANAHGKPKEGGGRRTSPRTQRPLRRKDRMERCWRIRCRARLAGAERSVSGSIGASAYGWGCNNRY